MMMNTIYNDDEYCTQWFQIVHDDDDGYCIKWWFQTVPKDDECYPQNDDEYVHNYYYYKQIIYKEVITTACSCGCFFV